MQFLKDKLEKLEQELHYERSQRLKVRSSANYLTQEPTALHSSTGILISYPPLPNESNCNRFVNLASGGGGAGHYSEREVRAWCGVAASTVERFLPRIRTRVL